MDASCLVDWSPTPLKPWKHTDFPRNKLEKEVKDPRFERNQRFSVSINNEVSLRLSAKGG